MQFQVSTDYAISIIYYLSKNDGNLLTAMDVAEQIGITYPHFIKVASKLKRGGFINTEQGRNGGYYLVRPATDITLYDIVCCIEGGVNIVRGSGAEASSKTMDGCRMINNVYSQLQTIITHALQHTYISDLNDDSYIIEFSSLNLKNYSASK